MYRLSVEELMGFNNLSASGQIQAGQWLWLVPSEGRSEVNQSASRVHFVKPGETLFRISQIYGVSVNDIMTKNELSHSQIKVGDRLMIP